MNNRGWICYDARCPICARATRRLGGIVLRRGFRLVPMQRRWLQERFAREPAGVPDELQLLLPDDQLLSGVDALSYVANTIWWARPCAWLMRIRWVRAVAARLYTWVATNRMKISRACGLDRCRR